MIRPAATNSFGSGVALGLLAIALAFRPATAAAETAPPAFTLDLAAPAVQEVALTVQAPAVVPVKILRSGGAPRA